MAIIHWKYRDMHQKINGDIREATFFMTVQVYSCKCLFMQLLQGYECAGQRLLIKFPDNPLSNGNVVIRKGVGATANVTGNTAATTSNKR